MSSYISIGLVYNKSSNLIGAEIKKIINYFKKTDEALLEVKYSLDSEGNEWIENKVNISLNKDFYDAITAKFNSTIVVNSNIFGIEDTNIVIRVYKETNYFGFLLDIDEEMNISKIGINELEQKICDIIFDIYRVSEFDYAFCDNEAEIEYSPDEFRNLDEKIYSIAVLPIIKDKGVELKLIKSNWKIDGYSLRV